MPSVLNCDVAVAGGGLSGALIALALAERRPDLDVRLIDSGTTFGGNHIWSFFGSDVLDAHRWLAAPLIAHGWKGYDVAFPGHARTLDQSYYSVDERAAGCGGARAAARRAIADRGQDPGRPARPRWCWATATGSMRAA